MNPILLHFYKKLIISKIFIKYGYKINDKFLYQAKIKSLL
jgi:hypothetical protein